MSVSKGAGWAALCLVARCFQGISWLAEGCIYRLMLSWLCRGKPVACCPPAAGWCKKIPKSEADGFSCGVSAGSICPGLVAAAQHTLVQGMVRSWAKRYCCWLGGSRARRAKMGWQRRWQRRRDAPTASACWSAAAARFLWRAATGCQSCGARSRCAARITERRTLQWLACAVSAWFLAEHQRKGR